MRTIATVVASRRPFRNKFILFSLILTTGVFLSACSDRMEPGQGALTTTPGAKDFQVAGSSTVAPFMTMTSEVFAATSDHQPPIIESTGTGGGFKLFCQGTTLKSPSIAMASRAMTADERSQCERRGVTDIIEMTFGYDGIVLIGSLKEERVSLSRRELYLALAKDLIIDGDVRPNPYRLWSDIRSDLPSYPIEVFGPPVSSGTRDAFLSLVMEAGARAVPEMARLESLDPDAFTSRATTIRTDGVWVDFGESDGQIVQALSRNPQALGVIGFSYLAQSTDRVRAADIDDVTPSFETIVSSEYGLSRPLFLYVKSQHLVRVPALVPFIEEAFSEAAMGADGYLADKGLIPLLPEERESILARFTRNVVALGSAQAKEKGQTL